MIIIRTVKEMTAWSRGQRDAGTSVGLVPTMGYLHEGHLSLIRLARENSDAVVVSVFVNPTQFGPNEDLENYPRNEKRDRTLCEEAGADVLFAPAVSEIYRDDRSIQVVEQTLNKFLCGASRPGHFDGVCTVVAKLFNITDPDVAVFGAKDAQQLRIIRRLVRDLNFPIEIIAGPTVRERDGLAMSSRNSLLNAEERLQAAKLYESLTKARADYDAGERDAAALKEAVASILAEARLGKVDYIELVDDESLAPIDTIERTALLAIAVKFSGARLIDNTVLGG